MEWYVAYATTIDTTAWGKKNYIAFTATDNAGVTGYGINQSNTTAPTYTAVTSTTKLVTMDTSGVSSNGTYYIWTKDTVGNVGKQSVSVNKIDTTAPTTATIAEGAKDSTGTKLNFTLKGTDSGSGIAKYIIYYGTSSSSMTSTKTITTTATSTTTQLTGLTSKTTYYVKVVVYDQAGNTKTSSTITTTTPVQILVSNIGTNETEVKTTLNIPSSTSAPTKLEVYSVEKENICAGIKVMKKIKAGDTIVVNYTVTRYGSYYLDIKDNQHSGTYSDLEVNPTTDQNGVVRNNSFQAIQDSDYYYIQFYKTNSTISTVYGTMEIYSITINGEKVL